MGEICFDLTHSTLDKFELVLTAAKKGFEVALDENDGTNETGLRAVDDAIKWFEEWVEEIREEAEY